MISLYQILLKDVLCSYPATQEPLKHPVFGRKPMVGIVVFYTGNRTDLLPHFFML